MWWAGPWINKTAGLVLFVSKEGRMKGEQVEAVLVVDVQVVRGRVDGKTSEKVGAYAA